ncbi:uncharacterized protein APUU_60735A [Aspergillus puulaauensis]|uniref:Tautomerase cis-CaaD-like domain-containing protein n=1 Tax=Aspergillus puulaauensis TaxID=1220207 RepID=A0A7R8AR44_9EURO|nr:uncharacterized protein APUU_60735A [Aspergillus puulaauensis]BCS27687.1 hypothetical protein APUU_60735A [Aspergillus puulaauensis]
MPFYQIEHATPLNKPQRDALATSITTIHTRKFATPSLFVNVRFTDASRDVNYVGGKECSINRITGYVRAGGNRSKKDFDDVALKILETWNSIVNPGSKKGEEREDLELKRVFVMGAITTGVESGFVLPEAGQDAAWLKENTPRFEELAEQGDPEFIELVREIRSREDLVA